MENIADKVYPNYVITKQKISFYFAAAVMLLVPFAEIIAELVKKPTLNMDYNISLCGIAGTVISAIFLIMDIKEKKFYPVDIFYLLLIFFAVISMIFAVGEEEVAHRDSYCELPTHFLCYFSLMLCCTHITDTKYRENLLKVFMFVAIIQCIIAFFQTLGIQIYQCYFDTEGHTEQKLAYGLTQHMNYFAGLCTLFLGLGAGAFLFGETKKKTVISGFLFVLFLYCSLSTTARLGWVGDTAVILFYLVSLIVMKKLGYDKEKLKKITKRFLILLVMVILTTAGIYFFTDHLSSEVEIMKNEAANGEDLNSVSSSRLYIWKYGLETVPSHWLTGLGLDRYVYSFYLNPNWEKGMELQRKGHNEYIHILVCEGVFALINYLSLLVYASVSGVKNVIHNTDDKSRFISWTLVSMAAGYICQAFFNSSVINVAIYFWIVLGLMMPITNQKALFKKQDRKKHEA